MQPWIDIGQSARLLLNSGKQGSVILVPARVGIASASREYSAGSTAVIPAGW